MWTATPCSSTSRSRAPPVRLPVRTDRRRYHRPVEGFQVRSEGPLTRPLNGTVTVGGAKNSALKLMAASLLASGRTVLENVPDILDVHVMARLLEELGCSVTVDHKHAGPEGSGTVVVDVPEHVGSEAPYDLVRRLRASISVLGP